MKVRWNGTFAPRSRATLLWWATPLVRALACFRHQFSRRSATPFSPGRRCGASHIGFANSVSMRQRSSGTHPRGVDIATLSGSWRVSEAASAAWTKPPLCVCFAGINSFPSTGPSSTRGARWRVAAHHPRPYTPVRCSASMPLTCGVRRCWVEPAPSRHRRRRLSARALVSLATLLWCASRTRVVLDLPRFVAGRTKKTETSHKHGKRKETRPLLRALKLPAGRQICPFPRPLPLQAGLNPSSSQPAPQSVRLPRSPSLSIDRPIVISPRCRVGRELPWAR